MIPHTLLNKGGLVKPAHWRHRHRFLPKQTSHPSKRLQRRRRQASTQPSSWRPCRDTRRPVPKPSHPHQGQRSSDSDEELQRRIMQGWRRKRSPSGPRATGHRCHRDPASQLRLHSNKQAEVIHEHAEEQLTTTTIDEPPTLLTQSCHCCRLRSREVRMLQIWHLRCVWPRAADRNRGGLWPRAALLHPLASMVLGKA